MLIISDYITNYNQIKQIKSFNNVKNIKVCFTDPTISVSNKNEYIQQSN